MKQSHSLVTPVLVLQMSAVKPMDIPCEGRWRCLLCGFAPFTSERYTDVCIYCQAFWSNLGKWWLHESASTHSYKVTMNILFFYLLPCRLGNLAETQLLLSMQWLNRTLTSRTPETNNKTFQFLLALVKKVKDYVKYSMTLPGEKTEPHMTAVVFPLLEESSKTWEIF